ncbi:MAG: molybdenum cofactor guanylyltransferase [Cognaticolwellia sp.]
MKPKNNLFQPCLGVVLAGGKSSRMGQDKASLIRDSENMLSYSQTLLKDAGSTQVVISGGEHGIEDVIENIGPLGGIASIISQFKPQALLILPVDLPLMTALELMKLKQLGELSQRACYFNDNYLPLYLPVNAYVEQFFQQPLAPRSRQSDRHKSTRKHQLAGPSVRSLLSQVPHRAITPQNNQCLFNANTPEQWQQAKHFLSLQRKPYV